MLVCLLTPCCLVTLLLYRPVFDQGSGDFWKIISQACTESQMLSWQVFFSFFPLNKFRNRLARLQAYKARINALTYALLTTKKIPQCFWESQKFQPNVCDETSTLTWRFSQLSVSASSNCPPSPVPLTFPDFTIFQPGLKKGKKERLGRKFYKNIKSQTLAHTGRGGLSQW